MSLTDTLAGIVGDAHVITDPDVLDGRSVDHTGRYRGHASALVRPGSADEVAEVLRACRDAGAHVTIQGGRKSLVAGTGADTTTCCCPPKGSAPSAMSTCPSVVSRPGPERR